jgi:DNA-binding winged helix-turn-helix (wHTH) protein
MNPSTTEIRFDGWVLRTDSGELARDGKVVRLQYQVLQVLLALLERPGAMVSREQLIARLWPKGVVDYETGLNTVVRKLRAALGDEAGEPRYIETIPRRGYRFIGEIEPSATSAPESELAARAPVSAPQARPRRTWAWLLAIAVLFALVFGARTLWQPATRSMEAYQHYVSGLYLWQRRLPAAAEHFEAALQKDPQYAEAWSGLAGALAAQGV